MTSRNGILFKRLNNPLISQHAVSLLIGPAEVRFAADRWELAEFMRNATNEDYLPRCRQHGGGFGYRTFIPAEPPFYGVERTARVLR